MLNSSEKQIQLFSSKEASQNLLENILFCLLAKPSLHSYLKIDAGDFQYWGMLWIVPSSSFFFSFFLLKHLQLSLEASLVRPAGIHNFSPNSSPVFQLHFRMFPAWPHLSPPLSSHPHPPPYAVHACVRACFSFSLSVIVDTAKTWEVQVFHSKESTD